VKPIANVEHAPRTNARPLLTPVEVAARLTLSRSTIYRLAEAGLLPAKRIGGQWRVDPSELEGWLAGQQVKAA
jgi:excisionase family DNA binding protein